MAYTTQQVEALEAALAEGAMRVKYDDPSGSKEITYQSRSEMVAQLNTMKRALGISSATRPNRILSQPSKGTNFAGY